MPARTISLMLEAPTDDLKSLWVSRRICFASLSNFAQLGDTTDATNSTQTTRQAFLGAWPDKQAPAIDAIGFLNRIKPSDSGGVTVCRSVNAVDLESGLRNEV